MTSGDTYRYIFCKFYPSGSRKIFSIIHSRFQRPKRYQTTNLNPLTVRQVYPSFLHGSLPGVIPRSKTSTS